MTTQTIQPPLPGTVWTHKKGAQYTVEAVPNLDATKSDYVPTVVYRDTTGKLWAKPLSLWGNSFTPAPEDKHMPVVALEAIRKSSADLMKRLDITAGMITMGERISWGADTALMREAAHMIERLTAGLEAANIGVPTIPAGHAIIRLADIPPAPQNNNVEWVCCGGYTPCRGQCAAQETKAKQ